MTQQHNATAIIPDMADRLPISAGYRRYMLVTLMLVFVVNYVDRQIINILAEPIKRDLNLADWQVGLMSGFAFSALYSIISIPIALCADRMNRVKIISAALAFWSFMTLVCGFAGNFVQLLLARVGVGVGEAGCMPPCQSFVADITPRERRARAFSVFALGLPIGALVAMSAGGLLAERAGWRAAFMIIGAPGLVLALIVLLTLREPRTLVAPVTGGPERKPFGASFADLKANRFFWFINLGAATIAIMYSGLLAFLASFFLRVHGAEMVELAASLKAATGLQMGNLGITGLMLGCLMGFGGITGTLLGGQVADRFAKGEPKGYIRLLAIILPLAAVIIAIALSFRSLASTFALLVPGLVLLNMWLAPVFAAINSIVAPEDRSFAVSLHQAMVTLLGSSMGPLSVGVLSDISARYFTGSEPEGLRMALMLACLLALVAAFIFWFAARTMDPPAAARPHRPQIEDHEV